MKKLLSLLLCLILCLSLFACNIEEMPTTATSKKTENSQNLDSGANENPKVDQYLKGLVEDNDLFSITVKRAIPDENNKSKYETKEFDAYNNLSSMASIAEYLWKLQLKPIDPPAAKQTSSVIFELKYKRYDNSTVEINFFDKKLKVSDKEWYEVADYIAWVSPSEFYETLKDTEHYVLPGVTAPDLSSFVRVEANIVDGKIQLDEDIVCVTMTYESFIEDGIEDGIVILQSNFGKIKRAIENLTLVGTAPLSNGATSHNDLKIYLKNNTYIYLSIQSNTCISINGRRLKPETRQQAIDLIYAVNVHGTKSPVPEEPVTIDENCISFSTKITTLRVSQNDYDSTLLGEITKTAEYSSSTGANNVFLNSVVDQFEKIELNSPVEIEDFIGYGYDYTEFRFYSESNQAPSDNCFMKVLLGEKDGVYYFKINNKYYAIEDSIIENLYSQITFSLQ